MRRPCPRFAGRWLPLALSMLAAGLSLPAPAMTLAELYPLALEADPSLRAARSAELAAQEKRPQARAALLPQLSLSAEQMHNALQFPERDSRYPSANQTLQLRQSLLRPAQWMAVEQAAHVAAEASAQRQAVERELLSRLSTAVFEHILAREQIALAQSLERTLEGQLNAAQRLFAEGSGVRTDIDEARARLDAARVQVLQAQLQRDNTLRQIERLTGLRAPAITALRSEDPQEDPSRWPSLAQLMQSAEDQQPTLRALEARVAIARSEASRVKAAYGPTVDLVSRLSSSRSENVLNPDSRYRLQQWGVQLNWPLYEGGATESAEREAVARMAEAEQRLDATRLDLQQKIDEQYRFVQEGRQRIAAQRQAVVSAIQLTISTRRSFEAGNRTRQDILNAEQQKMQAEQDLLQARLRYLAATVQLQLLAGPSPQAWLESLTPWFTDAGHQGARAQTAAMSSPSSPAGTATP